MFCCTESRKCILVVTHIYLRCVLVFRIQSTDNLVGGSYNGLINFFDLRKPGATIGQAVPLETSVIEKSHHDPVYDVFWISSKTGLLPVL